MARNYNKNAGAFSSEPFAPCGCSCSSLRSIKMSRGLPSMTALLGLLAIAGYQNRDKLAEMLGGSAPNNPAASGQPQQGGLGGLLSNLGSGGVGGLLGGDPGVMVE